MASIAGTAGHEIEHLAEENTQQTADFIKEAKKNPQLNDIYEPLRIYELDPGRIKINIIEEMQIRQK